MELDGITQGSKITLLKRAAYSPMENALNFPLGGPGSARGPLLPKSITASSHTAPTLVAGKSVGNSESVLLWQPDRKMLGLEVVMWTALAGLLLWLTSFWFLCLLPYVALITLAPLIRTLCRPCCVVTDREGLGIKGGQGARFALWGDITAYRMDAYCMYIYVMNGRAMRVDLYGYSADDILALQSLVRQKVDLRLHSTSPVLYRKSGSPAPI